MKAYGLMIVGGGGWTAAQYISHANLAAILWLGDMERLRQDPDLDWAADMAERTRGHGLFVLDSGRVVESGTHQELLDQNGQYAALYNMQFAEE